MRMHYAGQTFQISDGASLREVQEALLAPTPQPLAIKLDGTDEYLWVVVGGGIPVAFDGLTESDLPEPTVLTRDSRYVRRYR